MKNYKNKKGQGIGTLGKDRVFRKGVNSDKHLLKIMDAFGIELDVFNDLKKENCSEIRILDTKTGTIYSAKLDVWKEHSVERNFETTQVFLSRKFMEQDTINRDKTD